MTGLPQGWIATKLPLVCTKITDGTHHSPVNLPTGDFPYVTAKNIRKWGLDLSNITYVDAATHREIYARCPPEKGDVLYIKDGATTGLAIVNPLDEPFSMLSSVALIKPDHAVIEPEYLKNWLNSPSTLESMLGQMTGTAIRRLTLTTISAQEIPLPPLPEQRRMVRKLGTLSARSTTARTHLTAIEKLVERYKQSVLGQFFPDDIPTKTLGVSCTKIGSGATPRGGKNVYLPEGTPLIRSQNVRFGGVDWDGLAFISDEHADELRNVTVRTGDVLLNITGASIGRVCRAPEAMDGARVNQHVSIIRPRSQELDACFIQYFLSSPVIQHWIWNENYGVTRQALTKGMIEDINIPDISPEEQRKIVRRIETAFAKIDRLAAEAAKALKLLGHLDQRILAKAFAGDLVPQDPTDEPAETLLARIREARAKAPKGKRGRKSGVS